MELALRPPPWISQKNFATQQKDGLPVANKPTIHRLT